MPLLDHFSEPLATDYPFQSFHTAWVSTIMGRLNARLRPRYYAVANVHLGQQVVTDVAEFDRGAGASVSGNGEGGVAVATWAPPAATATVDTEFPDDIEVQILERRGASVLVAVIELVSKSNKDREDAREAFVAKCVAYLQRGIGLVIVDLVSERHFNLHNLLMERLDHPPTTRMSEDAILYASAYRSVSRQSQGQIDIWLAPLTLGEALPTMPLALRGNGCVPLELDATYTAARELSGF